MVSFRSGGKRWAVLLLFLAGVALCDVRAGLTQLQRKGWLSSGSFPPDGRGNFISEGQGLVEKCRTHYRSQVAVITEPTWKSHTTPSALPSSPSAHINTDTGNQEEVWKLEITRFSLQNRPRMQKVWEWLTRPKHSFPIQICDRVTTFSFQPCCIHYL